MWLSLVKKNGNGDKKREKSKIECYLTTYDRVPKKTVDSLWSKKRNRVSLQNVPVSVVALIGREKPKSYIAVRKHNCKSCKILAQ